MLLRQLRYFASVAEKGSVVAAAKQLRVAQPSLSRQMRQLEDTIGAPLLTRERRGVRLTAAGESLLARVAPLFERIEGTFKRVQLANEGRLGTLRVGLGRAALDDSRIGRAIADYGQRFPDVEIVMTDVPSPMQSDKLRGGELDVAIGLDYADEDAIGKQPLFEFPVDSAVLPAKDPLANAASLDIAQLRDKRLLVVDTQGTGEFPRLYAELRRAGITTWEPYDSIESVFGFVAAGRGWTLTASTIASNPPIGTAVVPLKNFHVPMAVVMRWPRGGQSALVAHLTSALFPKETARKPRVSSPRMKVDTAHGIPASFDLRHLRALAAIAEHGSLSRAAEQLGMTQSGVSRQIHALEGEIGIPLLQRDAHGVALTVAGEVLRREARAVLAQVDDAVANARQTVRGLAGQVRIAGVATEFSGEVLVKVLKHLAEVHPKIGVQISEMLSPFQVIALRDGRIDVGVAGANAGIMDDPVVTGVRLVEDVIECALLPTSHPLATRAWLKPSDLADVPFLFVERSVHPKFYDVVMSAFEGIGLVPKIHGSFNGPRTLFRAAADGIGWTLGSRFNRAHPLPGLVAVPIEGLQIPSGLQLIWRRDEFNPAVLAVIEAFRQPPVTESAIQ